VILGHFAARQAGDEAGAKKFLNTGARKLDKDWPYSVVTFLRGEIDSAALLKLADDDDKQTEAQCYLGLHHALKGDNRKAVSHLRWVKAHGTPGFVEWAIAVAELERLETQAKDPKP
jgi:lipoprotein NlpI